MAGARLQRVANIKIVSCQTSRSELHLDSDSDSGGDGGGEEESVPAGGWVFSTSSPHTYILLLQQGALCTRLDLQRERHASCV